MLLTFLLQHLSRLRSDVLEGHSLGGGSAADGFNGDAHADPGHILVGRRGANGVSRAGEGGNREELS